MLPYNFNIIYSLWLDEISRPIPTVSSFIAIVIKYLLTLIYLMIMIFSEHVCDRVWAGFAVLVWWGNECTSTLPTLPDKKAQCFLYRTNPQEDQHLNTSTKQHTLDPVYHKPSVKSTPERRKHEKSSCHHYTGMVLDRRLLPKSLKSTMPVTLFKTIYQYGQ